MKQLIALFTLMLLLTACKNETKSDSINSDLDGNIESSTSDSLDIPKTASGELTTQNKKELPAEIQAIFAAHGGLKRWKEMNNLCFEMKGKNGDETHTVSLPDKKTRIESKDWSIGYDGKKVWLLRHDVGYEGDPILYHNLMFNFFAMPFVLADSGTNYVALEPTELEGKMYNTYKISYKEGAGNSSKDNYKLYFDPKTNKMTWLAYTITNKNQKEISDWHYIKYDKWQDVNGLLLPEKITWYTVENDKPKGKEMTVKFDKITATETVLDASVFKKPAEARFVN